MFKLLDYDPINKYGEPTIVNVGRYDDTIKTACLHSSAYAPEINAFISSLKPAIGKLYALINAMGATEFFSCNRNGDAFYEDALKKYHPTFVENGHAFMHHKNKDPEKSYGKVIFSAYNDKMHRVELIVEYDTDKLDPKFEQRIENGEMVNVSMGCKVDSDYCSICGNRAKSPAFYCEHLRDNPGLTRCLPDGRKAFAINRDPHFFDISIVTIPADPTARVMAKIAADHSLPISSVQRAFEDDTFMKLASGKPYEIRKSKQTVKTAASIIPLDSLVSEGASELCNEFDKAIGPDIPDKILNLIGSLSDNPIKILKSFITRKIYLRPRETQRIILVSKGMSDIADSLDKLKTVVIGDPMEGMKMFDDECLSCSDGVAALPPDILEAREMSPVNIKKITIRVITDGIDKEAGAQTVPVQISDNMRYLLERHQDRFRRRNPAEPGSGNLSPVKDELETLGIVGAIIAAVAAMGAGEYLNPRSLKVMHRAAETTQQQMSNIFEDMDKPVQEMQFLNPRSIGAIQNSLISAMSEGSIRNMNDMIDDVYLNKTGSIKYAGGWSELMDKTLPKAALTLPVAYGLSHIISKDADNEAMKSYQVTGKYEPGILSRKSITFPAIAAALYKFSSAKKFAREYMKKGASLKLNKNRLLADLEKLLYDRENTGCCF